MKENVNSRNDQSAGLQPDQPDTTFSEQQPLNSQQINSSQTPVIGSASEKNPSVPTQKKFATMEQPSGMNTVSVGADL